MGAVAVDRQTVVSLLIVAAVLAVPVLLVVACYQWRKLSQRLRVIRSVLTEVQGDPKLSALDAANAIGREKAAQTTRLTELESRFAPVLSLDDEVERLNCQIFAVNEDLAIVRSGYAQKKAVYDRLLSEVAIFDDALAFAEMGVYRPHFEFSDSEDYKRAIVDVRERQKTMITAKAAVVCTKSWSVDGSASKGQVMTNRNIRLTLRAFNNECEAAIANARWNNVNAMEKRIARAQEQIDKLNATNSVFVTPEFSALKLEELYLTHEYREKLKQERDERTEAARLAREEQRLLRDLEKAQDDEDHYARLLAKAQAEADRVVGPRLDAVTDQLKMLERDLAEAHEKLARAQAMAEKTRTGYVYVISNVGSFGDEVVKIGLTRRLDPMDRVRELGDASVPFVFDMHAMIYSEDAPGLERALHAEFEKTRVNAQNYRKEFFRVSLDDVEAAVKKLAPTAPFFKDTEAQEYRETLAKRQVELGIADLVKASFPDSL